MNAFPVCLALLSIIAVVISMVRLVSLFKSVEDTSLQQEKELIKEVVEEKDAKPPTPQQVLDFLNQPKS